MSDFEPTPLRAQYLEIKRQHPRPILFFRLGDFYETFDGDAELVARELEIVLTSRANMYKGGERRVPMAGVPHHALESYLARLIAKGYHVAICEQTGAEAINGLFKREVIRVVTPGTVVEPNLLEAGRNNYLAALLIHEGRAALAHADITTGEFAVTVLAASPVAPVVRHELMRLRPAELLVPEDLARELVEGVVVPQTALAPWKFDPAKGRQHLLEHFGVASLAGFGLEQQPLAVGVCSALLQYVRETQPGALALLTQLTLYTLDDFMTLDPATRRNLELTETLRGGQVKGALLGVLDLTATAMGARLLRQWVNQPLLEVARINDRLDRVAALHADGVLRVELLAALRPLHDVERITNRILGGAAHPRDLTALRETLAALPALQTLLAAGGAARASQPLSQLAAGLDPCADLHALLTAALADEPPAVLGKPGLIRAGFSEELDGVLAATRHAREWIAGLEKTERERTGIRTLKVGYNKVFGYYLEISRGQSANAPEHYIRKQTLVNAERYITPELKEYETLVLNAEERILEIETRLFKEVCQQLGARAQLLLRTARALAEADVFAALAEAAARHRYVRPVFTPEHGLEIVNGRHPVVEGLLRAGERFVPNDVIFDPGESVRVITGPNMSGKCVTGETLVFTERGLTPIATLQPRPMPVDSFVPMQCGVKGRAGAAQASHFYLGGHQRTIRLRTRLGYEVEGTPEHRILVRQSDGTEGWMRLGEFEGGEMVAIDRQLNLWGDGVTLNTPRATTLDPGGSYKRYELPGQLTPDLAYVLGLLVGDGSLRERHQVSLTTGDAHIAREFARLVQSHFGYRVQYQRHARHWVLRITSLQIRVFLEELGLGYVTAVDKTVPPVVMTAPRACVAAFLQGLFDTDGTADRKGNVALSTSSPTMAHQVQMLLLNFGIVASRQPKRGVRSSHPNYLVTAYGAEALAFYAAIGFRLARKQTGRRRVSRVRRPNVGGIPHLSGALKSVQARIVATADKPVALKRAKAISSIFYTYLPNERNVSYAKRGELIAYCQQNGVACAELTAIAESRYFYDPVAAISPGEAEVYDLSVEPDHAFVANGFVNHNSTYLRQTALVVLMAQMGSFVPADEARLGVFDRIFTRIGAQDEIHAGQSTFMVEMVETANILHNATARSLLVLDEIGRGTSTYDGLSLAWAIIEHIHNHPRLKAKTLFATHYHELTDLAAMLPGVRNYNVAVTEEGDRVVFLHRIVAGGADRSYGIHVAQLAGLPRSVIARAQEIMTQLEASGGRAVKLEDAAAQQMALFPESNPLMEELKALDLNGLTPMEALSRLFEWQARFGRASLG